MTDLDVRIVKLESMLAASFYGFGESPEETGAGKMREWATSKGIPDDLEKHPTFGFNNPNPGGHARYGYEFWLKVDQRYEPEGDTRLIEFMGGLYAVAHCDHLSKIGAIWRKLWQWPEQNGYQLGSHQWLEKKVGETEESILLDLYCPIVEMQT